MKITTSPAARRRLSQGHIDESSRQNKINTIPSSLPQRLRVWIREKEISVSSWSFGASPTDLSKLFHLHVVMTVGGNKARAPSSGQHWLQHSRPEARIVCNCSTLAYPSTSRGRTQRSPGFSSTLLCKSIQQFACGFLFPWTVSSVQSCSRRPVRIRYVWAAARKRPH